MKLGIQEVYHRRVGYRRAWKGQYTLTAQDLPRHASCVREYVSALGRQTGPLSSAGDRVGVDQLAKQVGKYFHDAGRDTPSFGSDTAGVALIADSDVWTLQQVEQFVRLMEWVKQGASPFWLKVPSLPLVEGGPIYPDAENNYMLKFYGQRQARAAMRPRNFLLETGLFPFPLQNRYAGGCGYRSPLPPPRPVFEDLRAEGFFRHAQNIAPVVALMNSPGEELAGCVAWNAEPHDYYPALLKRGTPRDLRSSPAARAR